MEKKAATDLIKIFRPTIWTKYRLLQKCFGAGIQLRAHRARGDLLDRRSFRASSPESYVPKTFYEGLDQSGFTLIEMLVVIGIIILISVIAMPTVSSYFQLSLSSATRDLATNVKAAYNSTLVSGNVHRLVYDLKENKFWVESGPTTFLLDTKESKEKEDRRRKMSSSKDEAKEPKSSFTLETTITRKKISLPQGVEYEDILTQQSPNPVAEGTAYTHFFPHGLTEQTVIHLKDQNKHFATLVISAISGSTDLYDRHVDKAEIFGK